MAPFFFHTTHPASAPLFLPWTTSTSTWQQLVKTPSFRRLSMLPLLSESKHLTAIITKQTSLTSIGLQWVSLFILLFIYVLQLNFTVLHPRHKLQYFEKAGWKESWMEGKLDYNLLRYRPYWIWSNVCIYGCRRTVWRGSSSLCMLYSIHSYYWC